MTVDWSALADPVVILRIVAQVWLFALSALFSMSETALFSLRQADLDRIRQSGDSAGADRLHALLDEPRRLIVSILCGNELVNIAATINLAGIFLALFGDPATAAFMNTAVMLPLLLLFGEITPKTLAVTQPALLSQKIIGPVISVWTPLVAPLRAAVRLGSDRLTSLIVGEARDDDNILSADDFSAALGLAESDGAVSHEERSLITHLIAAGATPITAIMTPRPQLTFIDINTPTPDAIAQFRAARHRRVPVFRSNRDTIVGVLREETLLERLAQAPAETLELASLLDPPHFMPETVPVADLAEFLKDGAHHAVIAVSEFGGVEGVVTSGDVFTFLTKGRVIRVDVDAHLEEIEPGVWRCAGLASIASMRAATGLPLEEDAGAHTMGGLVMALLERMPQPGDSVRDGAVELTVTEVDGLLIRSLRVERAETEDEE